MSFSISSINDSIKGFLPETRSLIPKANNAYTIGSSSNLQYNSIFGNNIYLSSAPVSTSDFNKKRDIQPIGDALSVIMQLKPKSFKFKDGSSNRTHTGFIAQECEDLFCQNWAAYVRNVDDIGLRYEQFISLNTRSIQQLANRLVNVEEFSKQASQKLSTDFTMVDTITEKQSELNSIYDRLNAIENSGGNRVNNILSEECISRVNEACNLINNDRLNSIESSIGNTLKVSLSEECISRVNEVRNVVNNDLNTIYNRLQFIENNLKNSLTQECVTRINDMHNNVINEFEMKLENNIRPRLTEECKNRVNDMHNNVINEFEMKLENNVKPSLVEELKNQVNDMHGRVMSDVDNKIENERKLKEEKSREIESIINNFQIKFNEQICDLVDKVNILILKCNELENVSVKSHMETKGEDEIVNSPLQDQMVNLVDKVNFLISKCDDIETFKERYGDSLKEHSEEIELLLNFERTFRQEMVDLVSKVELLANTLESFKVSNDLSNEQEIVLMNGLLDKVNLLSGDINSIREKQDDSLREQSELNLLNSSFDQSFRQQMIELMEKVNLLATDLEVIKEAVSKSSNEQKSEELELISKLIDKINMLSIELQTIRETQSTNLQEHKVDELDLINGLMEKVNLLTVDLESFRENVKQSSLESSGVLSESSVNFESKFREQMLDLIEKVNSLVLRCNDLDVKLNNIPKPEKNKIEFEDSDSCGSSMMETIQERLYKAEQLIGKQQKMITKLTGAVNGLLRSNDTATSK